MSLKLTEEQWRRLDELFATASELPGEQQASFVEQSTASDAELRDHLLGMLRHSNGAANRIALAITDMVKSSSPEWIGRRLGPYRIVQEIGRGGMGIVFKAVRDDDQYSKTVALKVAPACRDLDLLRDRFRLERQILAGLEHPNIARLLEGGTDHGTPFFAMEYVDGASITDYCKAGALSVRERIELFRQVCAAVHYAHQHMVVHRDLKPSNIVVDRAGNPKLLDFGIAKLLTPDLDGGNTVTGTLWWTPDYTSPEQILGRNVTTRTDIYSLGLVLYELLTGVRAQASKHSSPSELQAAVCDVEPPLPSVSAAADGNLALSRELRGDLDRVVAMAIRKEPERRYGSIQEFSDDLGRCLTGRPVLANPGSRTYRAHKFIGRHRLAFAAGCIMVMLAATGLASTLYQAHRAEIRFLQLRKLANIFIFDVHDRIAKLPGATEARKMIVQTALEYLENLRADAAGDPALARELAGAYQRIGDVQGQPTTSNLGDTQGALISYRHAASLLSPLELRNDLVARRQLAMVQSKIGTVLRTLGSTKEALASYYQARDTVERALKQEPGDQTTLNLNGQIQLDLARILLTTGDKAGAAKASRAVIEISRALVVREPANREARGNLSVAEANLATILLANGELEEAAANFRSAIEVRAKLSKGDPDNADLRRSLMVGYGHLADALGVNGGMSLGDLPGAADAIAKAVTIAEWLCAKDPADRKAQFDLASAKLRLGSILADEPERAAEGIKPLEEAQVILVRLSAEDPKNYRYRYNIAFVDRRTGDAMARAGRTAEAERHFERAAALASQLLTGPDGSKAHGVMVYAQIGVALLRPAHDAKAGSLADSVATDLQHDSKFLASPWSEALIFADLGRVYRTMGRNQDSAAWFEKSSARWREVKASTALEPRRKQELISAEADLAAVRKLPH